MKIRRIEAPGGEYKPTILYFFGDISFELTDSIKKIIEDNKFKNIDTVLEGDLGDFLEDEYIVFSPIFNKNGNKFMFFKY